MGNLFDELKRRNVFRVGMVYAIVGWLLVQVTSIAVPAFAMPGWVTTVVFYFVLVGFPVALLFAWAFELTPEGLRPTGEVDLNTSTTVQTGQKLNYLIAVALVLALGFIAYQNIGPKPDTDPTRTQIAETQTSIAVLPFADLSPEGDQEYFSDGISEELLNVLVRIEGLRVASRTSAFAFKGGDRNIVEIANVLGVNHVLEGSVRKAGDRVWITAQLIDAETDTHMWSETYDRGLTDIFAIQDEIAGAIVAALRETLGITIEKTETVAVSTENLDAYDLYLRAVNSSGYGAELPRTAIALLEQAVRLDPDFARAWAELASWKAWAPGTDFAANAETMYQEANAAAEKAVSLRPLLGAAHMALAKVASEQHDWATAIQEMDKAVDLAPEDSWALFSRGSQKVILGYLSDAVPDIASALHLEPNSGVMNTWMSLVQLSLGRREGAFKYSEPAMEYQPGLASTTLAELYLADGRVPEAAMQVAMYYAGSELLPLVPHINRLLTSPNESREDEIRRFWSIAKELGFSKDFVLGIDPVSAQYRLNVTEILTLQEFELMAGRMRRTSNEFPLSWLPSASGFRQSEAYRNLIRESGIADYWRDHGWPDLCRPLGPDDFECD